MTTTGIGMQRAEAARDVIYFGRKLAAKGFHDALAGNISVRLDDGTVLCTCAGAQKDDLSEENLAVCDMQGEVVSGNSRPTSEILMHLTTYEVRPDVKA